MGKKKKEPTVTIVDKPKTINVEYQLLVAERDDLLAAEEGYRKRIQEVEKEKAELLHSFDILYNENAMLRSKLDAPEGVGVNSVESYNSVFKDREHLRDANKAYKRRIKQLEDDANEAKNKHEKLNTKYQLLSQKAELEVEYATKNRDEKIDILERDQEELSEKLKMFYKEKEQYEYRIAELDKERNELQNRYDSLSDIKHELQLRCDVLQADREKLKEKVLDLEAEIPDPEQKAKEEQHYLSLQGQVAALQVANKDSSVEIHKLREEIRELNKLKKERVETLDRACSVFVNEEEEQMRKAELEQQEEIQKEIEESKQRGIFLLKENDRLKSEKVELESKLAYTELERKRYEDEFNKKKDELENMTVMIKGNESLSQDYVFVQEKLNDLTAAKHVLENELIKEKRDSKLKLAELNNDKKKLEQQVNDLEKQGNKSSNEATKLQYECDNLTKVTEAQALELRNMKAQLEQIQSLLEDRNLKYEQMKKSEKEAIEELHENRILYHTMKREYENLRKDKGGDLDILKEEMETAKTARNEESEQLRQETVRLREEVKQLKQYEFKITTMDAEIRRLMNRIRMTDRYKKMPRIDESKIGKQGDTSLVEIRELKRKHRELEKEKLGLLQERKQWEVLKERYASLQSNNKRLMEENKRIRGDLDGTTYKIDTLEKRFKTMNVKVAEIKIPGNVQKAVYVEKIPKHSDSLVTKYEYLLDKSDHAIKTTHLKAIKPSGVTFQENGEQTSHVLKATTQQNPRKALPELGKSHSGDSKHESSMKSAIRKKINKKSSAAKLKLKRQTPPKAGVLAPGLSYGKGYKELHKNRYDKPQTLALL